MRIDFTEDELEDIYLTYISYGVLDTPVIYKILEVYTYCDLCNHLFLKSEFRAHYFGVHDQPHIQNSQLFEIAEGAECP